jgi:hypothetical protein
MAAAMVVPARVAGATAAPNGRPGLIPLHGPAVLRRRRPRFQGRTAATDRLERGDHVAGPRSRLGDRARRWRKGASRSVVADTELRDRGLQRLGFLSQRMAGSGRLLDHGRILLRDLIHLIHSRVDLG